MLRSAAKKSFGVIVVDAECRVLLVQRKDSFGYLGCVDNDALGHEMVAETLSTITIEERDKLLEWEWDKLWQDCGLDTKNNRKAQKCRARFEWLSIRDVVRAMDQRGEQWQLSNEWGLPKGRMAAQDNETALRCALREMQEETGLHASAITVLHDVGTFTDEYQGTDGKTYSSTYYVAKLRGKVEGTLDTKEVRQIRWMTLDECAERVRPKLLDIIKDATKLQA